MADMIVTPTERNGVFTVHRHQGEKPFAELSAPRVTGNRRWGVKYRGPDPTCPFHPSMFNVSKPTYKAALEELEQAIAICSDAQLCLE